MLRRRCRVQEGSLANPRAQSSLLLLQSLPPTVLRILSFSLSSLFYKTKWTSCSLLQGNILAMSFKSTIFYRHDCHSPFALMWLVGVMTPSYAIWAIKNCKRQTGMRWENGNSCFRHNLSPATILRLTIQRNVTRNPLLYLSVYTELNKNNLLVWPYMVELCFHSMFIWCPFHWVSILIECGYVSGTRLGVVVSLSGKDLLFNWEDKQL